MTETPKLLRPAPTDVVFARTDSGEAVLTLSFQAAIDFLALAQSFANIGWRWALGSSAPSPIGVTQVHRLETTPRSAEPYDSDALDALIADAVELLQLSFGEIAVTLPAGL